MRIKQNETLFGFQSKQKKTWLSHTALEISNRCKRCYYLQYKYKIRQPEGIQSRLANRFDTVLKSYFDIFRKQEILPPMISKELSGILENPFKDTYFHSVNDLFGFYGKLDECLVFEGKYIPVDFKTSSSDPRDKDIFDAYKHQIDEYVFLLEQNKRKTAGYGYLIFFYPEMSMTIHTGFPMVTHIVKVEAHANEVEGRIQKAIDILESDLPDSNLDCPFCAWFTKVKDYYI